VFHVTHRCHDRAFLLKFARDRGDAYRAKLREHLPRFDVALLDYLEQMQTIWNPSRCSGDTRIHSLPARSGCAPSLREILFTRSQRVQIAGKLVLRNSKATE
jgi:hypothetical protein